MVWKVCLHTYMDDSRVSSLDRQTHLRHLEAFFTALAANGLAINLEKCVFPTPFLEILGHRISATGAAPTADHAARAKRKVRSPAGHLFEHGPNNSARHLGPQGGARERGPRRGKPCREAH
jgi:hypothetical protein